MCFQPRSLILKPSTGPFKSKSSAEVTSTKSTTSSQKMASSLRPSEFPARSQRTSTANLNSPLSCSMALLTMAAPGSSTMLVLTSHFSWLIRATISGQLTLVVPPIQIGTSTTPLKMMRSGTSPCMRWASMMFLQTSTTS
jgi:hypothetical protein